MQTVGEIIARNRSAIVEAWADEAQRAASARGLSRPEFENVIPLYVEALTHDGGHRAGRLDGRRRELVENHLATRLNQGFDLTEVVEEFAILGRVVARFCDRAGDDGQPSKAEMRAFHSELAEAVSMVADTFREHLLKDEQADKRYARLLEQIASEALRPGAPPFSERLDEVVGIIAEAMDAKAAALLLYENESNHLITTASAGVPGPELKRYSAWLGPASFAGFVAEQNEPATIFDVPATPLEVSPGFREVGVQTLVGIRLLPHRTLTGVLLLGRGTRAGLSLADHVKLVTLGQRLTLHLENARLYAALVAQVEALTAERALRERFVSILAHDLRGPLSAAKSGARLLMEAINIPDEERDIATRVDASLDRADRMIRDLLDAARVRVGERLPLDIAELDPAELASQVVEELRAVHGPRFVLGRCAPGRVFWSAHEIRRALWNLLTNAVKYGDTSSMITVEILPTDDHVALSVHNWGQPLSPEDCRRVFDPYVRTAGARAQGAGKGWGLGLTLVRGCAEAHGGTVEVASSKVRGTRFTLVLPRDARARGGRVLPPPAPVARAVYDDAPEPSEATDRRASSEVRSDALALHEDVRGILRSVLESIRRLERDQVSSPTELRVKLAELVDGLRRLYAAESNSLEPALRALDAWGEQSVSALRAQHDREMGRLAGVRTEGSSSKELARQAREMVRLVLRALRLEEVTVLGLDRWSDDLTVSDQEAG
jgi:signal transduction histidine kinase